MRPDPGRPNDVRGNDISKNPLDWSPSQEGLSFKLVLSLETCFFGILSIFGPGAYLKKHLGVKSTLLQNFDLKLTIKILK